MHYEERLSVWMQVSALYIGCVYMPTDCMNSASIEGRLKEEGKGNGGMILMVSL